MRAISFGQAARNLFPLRLQLPFFWEHKTNTKEEEKALIGYAKQEYSYSVSIYMIGSVMHTVIDN